MKRLQLAIICAFALFAGCCNYMTRTDGPSVCAPHPYYCTWEDLKVLALPFSSPKGPEGGIAKAYAIVFFPAFLVDLPCEAVLDTLFLPADWANLLTKENDK